MENGEIGIFVVNAGTEALTFQAELDLARYQIAANTRVSVKAFASDGNAEPVHESVAGIIALAGALAGHEMTMFRIEIAEK